MTEKIGLDQFRFDLSYFGSSSQLLIFCNAAACNSTKPNYLMPYCVPFSMQS